MSHFITPSYLGAGKLPTLDELQTHKQRKKRNKELYALQEIINSKTVISESEFEVLKLTEDSYDDDIRKCLNNLTKDVTCMKKVYALSDCSEQFIIKGAKVLTSLDDVHRLALNASNGSAQHFYVLECEVNPDKLIMYGELKESIPCDVHSEITSGPYTDTVIIYPNGDVVTLGTAIYGTANKLVANN